MGFAVCITTRYPLRRWLGRWRYTALALLTTALLQACSNTPAVPELLNELPALQLGEVSVPVEDVPARVHSPDLLLLDDQMREFVARYTGDVRNDRQRLMMLHRAIKGPATLGLEYDPAMMGTAEQVFYRGSANCLSYANLFIALAREAGLDARYQWVGVRPQWTRQGERVALTLHVNVEVKLGSRERYQVDIDPLPSRDITGTRLLNDADALALHHSNRAMAALADQDTEQAWLQSVRALQLSPWQPHLWVNLGAVYRAAGQYAVAESSYLQALQLDPWERSAMTNLAYLYDLQGRQQEREYWERQVEDYRESNPFYHAWLGEQAAEMQDWPEARRYYERALQLRPGDSALLYALALAHEGLGEPAAARDYLQRAIDSATRRSDLETYKAHLNSLGGTGSQAFYRRSIRI